MQQQMQERARIARGCRSASARHVATGAVAVAFLLGAPPCGAGEKSGVGAEPSSEGITGSPRLLEVGPLVGVSARFGSARGIKYRPGVAVGAYLRPVLTDWLNLQLYGRFESIPVDVEAGAFDWDGVSLPYAFEQNPLRLTSIGAALEPSYSFTRRLRIYGSLGAAWVRFDADAPSAPGFEFEATRTGIEVNILFGVGVAYDIVPRFVTLHLSTSYGVAFDQRGTAYEPLQVIEDGAMVHLAPLPEFNGMADLLLGISAAF